MSTPLRYAAGIAREGAAVPAAGDGGAVGDGPEDEALYLSDVNWIRDGPARAAGGKTPTKLRQAIDAAAAQAVSAATSPAALPSNPTPSAKDSGVKLRTAVVDAVSQLEALLDDARFRVERNRARCVEAGDTIMETLKAFDAEFKYTDTVGFGVPRLVQETHIATDLQFQARYGPSITVPDKQRFLSVLELLREGPVTGREADAMRSRIETNVTRPLLPLDDAKIPALLLNINGFTTTDALASMRQKLDTLNAKTRRLSQELESLNADASAARSAEDFVKADSLEGDIIAKMQEIFSVHVQRLQLVGASESAQTTGMAGQLEAIMSSDAIDRIREQNEGIRAAAENDGKALDADRATRHKLNQQCNANYAAAVQRSTERLERNAYQQSLVWDEVAKGLARIDDLRRDAAGMVEEHLRLTETERKRMKEYKEYQASYATHREYVRLVGENTGVALDFLAELDRHMNKARETIREMRVEERVAALAADERKQLDVHYTAFSGRCVRRSHALSVRATNAERQLREASFQQRQAAVSDDPDGKTHGERGEALMKAIAGLEHRIAAVEAIFEDGQERYTAIMAGEEGFDPTDNAAVNAVRLRKTLREQFTASLEG
eukprot:CAMPEP_0174882136 /NCGR_PEP_ID=MMETSP1114-20130205/84611_1 /TAXON_ID=312471 /ORGANISM="Neobodo designis, Strain CCAP 1951/1" /LENGTH=609 /DNA_ID=CAMNT_0016117533 /DNA_START=55 /DNA_END=1880 /DNA_ORIENTATION=-